MIDWIRWTCIWHLKIWRETQAPPDYAGLLWLQWCLKLKAFQTKPLTVCVWSLKKWASGCGLCLFIYKHQYAWQWRKIYQVMFIYNSHSRMHGFVHGKNIGEKLTTSHSLLLHSYCTQIHRERHGRTSAVSFFYQRWLENLIISTKVSQ